MDNKKNKNNIIWNKRYVQRDAEKSYEYIKWKTKKKNL